MDALWNGIEGPCVLKILSEPFLQTCKYQMWEEQATTHVSELSAFKKENLQYSKKLLQIIIFPL